MFTVTQVKGFKPKSTPYYKWYSDETRGSGKLGLQVTPKGSKKFVFRYFKDGKAKFIQLGKFPDYSLEEAKKQSKAYGVIVSAGKDPKEEIAKDKAEQDFKAKQDAKKGSIEQLFTSYANNMEKDGKRTFKAVLSALEKETYPYLSKETKAKDVTSDDIFNIIAGIISRGAATQSNRVRSFLMAAFQYGLQHDFDPAKAIKPVKGIEPAIKFGLTSNPVSSIPKQKSAENVGEHFLTKQEVKQLLHDLTTEYTRFKMGNNIRNAIQLTFHTGGQRPYELIASKWESIDWDDKTLLVTPNISKNKKPHLIPLTDSAILILKDQKLSVGDSEYIFPHRFDPTKHIRTDSISQAIARYRDTTNIRPFIPRDIRRTCKTLMGALGVSKSIRDILQNHALQDVSSKHYDKHNYLAEKRIALESWESFLQETPVNNVVALRGNK
jgi:integrase